MAGTEKGLHRLEDDLSDTWLEDWASAGVAEIEALLGKHAAFLTFLEVHVDKVSENNSGQTDLPYQEAA